MAGAMRCANPGCRGHKERIGGRFKFRGGEWFCVECHRDYYPGEPGKDLWNFETANIGNDPNAGPIHVKSLRHLRELEQQYGVVCQAANFDSTKWN